MSGGKTPLYFAMEGSLIHELQITMEQGQHSVRTGIQFLYINAGFPFLPGLNRSRTFQECGPQEQFLLKVLGAQYCVYLFVFM